jgi:general stress protein YciG
MENENSNWKPVTVGKRGFASMAPERLKQVASQGGRSVKSENRAFSRDLDLAKRAAIASVEKRRKSE